MWLAALAAAGLGIIGGARQAAARPMLYTTQDDFAP